MYLWGLGRSHAHTAFKLLCRSTICGSAILLGVYMYLWDQGRPDAQTTFKLLCGNTIYGSTIPSGMYAYRYIRIFVGSRQAICTNHPAAVWKKYIWKYYTTRRVHVFVGSRQVSCINYLQAVLCGSAIYGSTIPPGKHACR